MIVTKFGGTSLDDGAAFVERVGIVRERQERGCLVVASAMAGVSRALLRLGWLAEGGVTPAVDAAREQLLARHRQVLLDAGLEERERAAVEAAIDAQDRRLRELLAGVAAAGELRGAAKDRILAVGELLSSRLLAAVLASRDIPVAWIDPRDLVVSDERFGDARPDPEATRANVRRLVDPLLGAGRVAVTGGFIARSPGGATTTLGWGASDTSAALLGVALGAPLVEIWTDVDGIASTDPRLVADARLIAELSYDEAAELTFFGAQVLHYTAIAPARRAGCALRVRNSLRPDAPGTLIHAGERLAEDAEPVRGVALAGPVERRRLPERPPCGLGGTGDNPPWALVKGRTLPGEEAASPAESVAVVAMVGRGIGGRARVRERAAEVLAPFAAEPFPDACASHLAFVLAPAQGVGALRSLHAVFCAPLARSGASPSERAPASDLR